MPKCYSQDNFNKQNADGQAADFYVNQKRKWNL